MPNTPVIVHLALTTGDAHERLRALIHEVTGFADARLTHACRSCGSSDHGRPVVIGVPRMAVSVSRTRDGDTALVACAEHPGLGVDVEACGAANFAGFANVALHPKERCLSAVERTQLWVRKEALLKAHGIGLERDPRTIQLAANGSVIAGPTASIHDLDLGPGLQAALALTPPATATIQRH